MEAIGMALSTLETLLNIIPELKYSFSFLNYNSELESLQEILDEINYKLLSADKTLAQGGELSTEDQILIEKVKDAIYEADDLLDEYATGVRLQQLGMQSDTTVWSKVCSLFSPFKSLSLACSIGRKAKRIKIGLEGLASKLTIKRVDGPTRRMKETASCIMESLIVGRENDKERIIDILLHPDVQMDVLVLAIVGVGGLGKTALAQLVFNDARIQKEFYGRTFWVCVSDQGENSFSVKAILASILKSVASESCVDHKVELEHLLQKLRSQLDQNKVLLVLDDVWTEKSTEWFELEHYLLGLAVRGSKVMVTTRSKVTATTVRSSHIYELQGLSDESSWHLFKIMSGLEEANHDLVELGNKIVKKCANVPLAIKVVGSFLHGQNEDTWRTIEQSGLNAIREDHNDQIMSILKFSYYHLLPSIKSCFSYCALFPKDHIFDKDYIISLWMAHDYVKDEAVAERYFEILAQRCFFQDVNDNLETVSFKIHDLMHDLAQQVTEREIFTANSATESLGKKIRHLYDNAPDIRTEGFMATTKIRTYIAGEGRDAEYGPTYFPLIELLTNWRSIRVLNLQSLHIHFFPDAIGELLHVRHLDLSYNEELKKLPESLTKLINLQFLGLIRCRLEELPKDLHKLVNLRTLKVGDKPLSAGWRYWTPHFGFRYMPPSMDKMTCLTRITLFAVGQSSSGLKQDVGQLKDLRSLIRLRGHLEIVIAMDYKHAKENDDKGGYLCGMQHLNSVVITWQQRMRGNTKERVRHDEDLLEDLQPHHNLKRLRIRQYPGVRALTWAKELPNLVEIQLSGCPGIQELRRLGNLQHLKYLHLQDLRSLEYMEPEKSYGAAPVMATTT